jgi:hypothetical protein
MNDNQKREGLLDKVKSSVPGMLRTILPLIPGVRTLGTVLAGSVLVFSIAFPGMLDADIVKAVLTSLGV